MTKRLALLLVPLLSAGAVAVPGWAGTAAKTELVSQSSTGEQGNDRSYVSSISASGRFVAFDSDANNLVPNDTNGQRDVFVRDMDSGDTQRVSVSSAGAQGNRISVSSSISADGRFVAFSSRAGTLVQGDVGGRADVFVRDLETQTTQRVSLSSTGAPGNNGSGHPSISADGRFVAFLSDASNLVPKDTNGWTDVFVRDLKLRKTRRVSVGSAGAQALGSRYGPSPPSISADGRYVAFASDARNLVKGDTNRVSDVFVHDLRTGKTRRISVTRLGRQAGASSSDPSLSGEGRFVAFDSFAHLTKGDKDLASDIFVRDLKTNRTRLVSRSSTGDKANRSSFIPSIGAHGRYVAFVSPANNLVPGDSNAYTDVFVRDLKTSKTRRVSVNSAGGQSNGQSYYPAISAEGRFVAFESSATNLIPNDANGGIWDIFRRGPLGP